MSLSMHAASAPVFMRMLANLDQWLVKAEAYAAAKKFEPAVLLAARLAPDMLPLVTQVQIASDAAKFCMARLAGIEAPKFADTETTIADLRERVRRTIAFVESVPAASLEGSEAREVTVPRRGGPLVLKGEAYLEHYAAPTFYFHVTMTYALLRHNGVDLGKADFLGG